MYKFLKIDDKCDACAKCIPVCPQQVLVSYALKARSIVDPSRWSLCDGCGACVDACDRDAIRIVELTSSFFQESICYFDDHGAQNTLKVCELVADRVKRGIKYVVIASGSGSSALILAEYLKDLNVKLIVETTPPIWKDICPYPSIPSDNKERLESLGIEIMEDVNPVIECGPKSIDAQFYEEKHKVPWQGIWELLHGIGGQGFSAAVEAVFTAVREKKVPLGGEVIGLGGTGGGLDIAIVMKATPYEQMLSGPIENRFNILEILAVPKRKKRYW